MKLALQKRAFGITHRYELLAVSVVLAVAFLLRPALVAVLLLAFAGLVILHERPAWGFWLIVLLTPVETFGPISFKMTKLVKLALTAIVAVGLYADSRGDGSQSGRDPYRWPLILFLAAGMASSLLARSPLMSFAGWSSVAIFAFFYTAVRRRSGLTSRGPLLLKIVLATAVLSSLLCLYQMTHGYSGFWTSAEQQAQAADQNYDTLWPLVFRASGAFNGPNAAGAFLAIGTIIALARAYTCRRFRWLALVAAVTCWMGMLSAFSRGALLGSIVGCSFALWVAGGVTRVRAAVFLLIAGLFIANVAVSDTLRSALRLGGDIASSSPTRIDAWHAARILVERNPVFGIGFYQFRKESQGLIGTSDTPEHPHDGFLKALVEEGPVGGFAYLLFVVQFIVLSRRGLRCLVSMSSARWVLTSVAGIGASLFTQELFDAGFAMGASSIAILFASLLAVQAAMLNPRPPTLATAPTTTSTD